MNLQATAVVSTPEVVTADGLYFEDMVPGITKLESGWRRITDADIRIFARLTGDTNAIHMDERAAAESIFRRRIAHGQLVTSLATGLAYQIGMAKGTAIFEGLNVRKFKRPAYIGDSITLKLYVLQVNEVDTPPNFGRVVFEAPILNQKGKVLQDCVWTVLYSKRPHLG